MIPPNIAPLPLLVEDEIYTEEIIVGDIVITELGVLSREEFIELYESGDLKWRE